MRRRNVVYSGSRTVPQPSAAPKPPVAKPQPKKRFAWRRALVPGFIALALVLAGALWLSQPPAVTQAQVAALVHQAIEDVPPTMRSTAGLRPGDEVLAVGFPFGIGPSASAGVISGLKRDYVSPEGKRVLSNLIQFDAAVNPGNSGGPLVTLEGEVVGIVTGLLNPTEHRVFIGIGFAVPIENAASAIGLSPF